MSETDIITDTMANDGDVASIRKRIAALRAKRIRIEAEIRQLSHLPEARCTWGPCTRCGHVWQGHWSGKRPRHCARCHSAGWEDAPVGTRARTPSDPPNPRWHKFDAIPRPTKRQIAEKFLSLPVEEIKAALPDNIQRQIAAVTDNIERVLRIPAPPAGPREAISAPVANVGAGLPPPPDLDVPSPPDPLPMPTIFAPPALRPPAMSTAEVIERFMEGEVVAAPAVLSAADQAEEAARE